MKNNFKITIIGYGRFGRLLARSLPFFGDISVISSKKINEKNIKQVGFADLKNSDLVIPSVPISTLKNLLKKISPNLKPGAIVMDVCSVKSYPCRWLKQELPKNIEIIGSHPMFGPDSAKHGLKGLQIVLCPLRISPKNYSRIKDIFKKLKLKIIETTPEEHDKQAATCLALVHFIGRGLGKIGFAKQSITTLGFERLLAVNETVNNDTWQLFIDMQRFNPYTKKTRKNYLNALNQLDKKINLKKEDKNEDCFFKQVA
jgi:prephenate dehydrogenase